MSTYALSNTDYIGTAEVAALAGCEPASVRTQMRAMRQRQKNPVDLRVPDHQRPVDVGSHITLYWRRDIEDWVAQRERRAARRAAQQ